MGRMEWSEGEKWDNCNSIINKYIKKIRWACQSLLQNPFNLILDNYFIIIFYPYPRTCLLILESGVGGERERNIDARETSFGCFSHMPDWD